MGPVFRVHASPSPVPGDLPTPACHRFRPSRVSPPFSGGLVCTSSVSWPSMVLRGSIMVPQVLPADRRQLVPGRWSQAAGCGSQSSGGLRQLHPLLRLQVPSIQRDVLAMPPAGFLQGPGCDLGIAVVMAPGKDKGRALTWGSPPFKTRTTVIQSAGTRKLQLG